jgi:glyoxylase-like metal-dependent hydrolase (beta-lactamase superfamily II)
VARFELDGFGVVGIRADNPGPLTLSGTNSWIVSSEPAWLVDPGPDVPEHLFALVDELGRRGGLGGIALTHDHPDHGQAVAGLRERFPAAPLAGGRGPVDVTLSEGTRFGPLEAVSTPGHAPDHFAFVYDRVGFTGDAVLGEGSVFIAPDPGALSSYLDGLTRLRRRRLEVLCPGHGPPIWDPDAKLDEYVKHRLDREQRLVTALGAGARSLQEMLDAAWGDVPDQLRPAAAVTLAAHLDKLAAENRLPDGVQRPATSLVDGERPRVQLKPTRS